MITPNGRSTSASGESVLFGVLPQPIIGVERVTNGDFATGDLSGWTTTGGKWTYSDGKVRLQSSNTDASPFYQDNIFVIGKTYRITFDAVVTLGQGKLEKNGGLSLININTTKTYDFYWTADRTQLYFNILTSSPNTDLTLDNISVKEYTTSDMDFTRATTATFINNTNTIQGTSAGIPRLDYTGTSCPHILVEPQRTNLLDDGNAAASLTEVTVTNTTSPDGTANALKLTETTANDQHFATISEATVSSGSVYTMSIFVKKGTQSSVTIYTQSSRMISNIAVDLDAGSVVVAGTDIVSGSGTISSYVNNWYRVAWSGTANASGAMSIYATVKSLATYTGSTSEYTEYFGGQVELGSYATSYIPTSGSTVTRNGEVFERTGIADLINSAEGVLFIEMAALADSGIHRQISLNDGTNDNRVSIGLSNSSNIVSAQVVSGGAFQANKTNAMTQTNFNKIALKWKANDMALWLNGSEVATDSSVTVPIGLDTLDFNRGDDANWFFGKVRQIQVYKTALSDTQLGALTT